MPDIAMIVRKLVNRRVEFTLRLGYGSAGEELAVRIYGDRTLKDAIPEASYLGYLRWWVVYPLEERSYEAVNSKGPGRGALEREVRREAGQGVGLLER